MTRMIALLRGVNVGRGNRVPMADWRELLAALGYSQVTTLLNSGNAVFETGGRRSPAHHGQAIATALADPAADASRMLLVFAQHAEALARLAPIAALTVPPERLVVGRHAAYLCCASGILKSKAGAALLGKLGAGSPAGIGPPR